MILFLLVALGCSNGVATVNLPQDTETIPEDTLNADSGELEDTAG